MISQTGQEMLQLLPDYYAAEKTAVVIDVQGKKFDELSDLLAFIIEQIFVMTASGWGLDYWERELGLSSYVGKPGDQRRSRIISKLRGLGTVTVLLIKNVAESYAYGTVEVTEYPETYSFKIKFVDARGVPPNLDDLEDAIEKIKPAHLAVIYEFTYTTWSEVKAALTWGDVKTGTWGELKSREIV